MGSDDLFKKRRAGRKQRKYAYRPPRANSFLIVTEGEKTEPLYFKGIKHLIEEKIGGTVNVVSLPLIDIQGKGCSTDALVKKTDEIVSEAKILYQNIWIVFDKDDFSDFDYAINEAVERGYKVAWSNESFEYWLYLHFNYSDSALTRHDWCTKLDEIFRQYNLGEGIYQKNYEDIYNLVDSYDGVNTAIKNAKRRMSDFDKETCRPSEYNPGTTVYQLVEELKSYLDEK